ncbi:hypothetical protein MLD38_019606 [Melastoma candidum]|uniref:Uncharacterized protein n=1 Tax=Melastoma candidum TaxID=119954 RepID=A0ACB9R0M4_9MYRT|nr:hypothetical protein MLD38_019606 [Melastoma candidum]
MKEPRRCGAARCRLHRRHPRPRKEAEQPLVQPSSRHPESCVLHRPHHLPRRLLRPGALHPPSHTASSNSSPHSVQNILISPTSSFPGITTSLLRPSSASCRGPLAATNCQRGGKSLRRTRRGKGGMMGGGFWGDARAGEAMGREDHR